jgi:AbrB family looped-hinge helix DNA binding protein
MRTKIDSAGRLVVPKALREALSLTPGQPLEARITDGRLEIEPAATPMRLVRRGRGVVAVPRRKLPPLSAAEVRSTLEGLRR